MPDRMAARRSWLRCRQDAKSTIGRERDGTAGRDGRAPGDGTGRGTDGRTGPGDGTGDERTRGRTERGTDGFGRDGFGRDGFGRDGTGRGVSFVTASGVVKVGAKSLGKWCPKWDIDCDCSGSLASGLRSSTCVVAVTLARRRALPLSISAEASRAKQRRPAFVPLRERLRWPEVFAATSHVRSRSRLGRVTDSELAAEGAAAVFALRLE
jgi:hypothetical protein